MSLPIGLGIASLRVLLGLVGVGYSLLKTDYSGADASISNEILKNIMGGTVGNAVYDLIKGGGASALETMARQMQQGDVENLNHDLQRAARKAQLTATLLATRACLAEIRRTNASEKSLWSKASGLIWKDQDEKWLSEIVKLWRQKIDGLPNEIPPQNIEHDQIINLLDSELNFAQTDIQKQLVEKLKEDALAEIRIEYTTVSPIPDAAYELLKEAIKEGWNEVAEDKAYFTSLNLQAKSLYRPEQKAALINPGKQFDWFSLVCGFFNEEYKTNERVNRAMQKYLLLDIRDAQGSLITKDGKPVAADVFLGHFEQFDDSFVRLEGLLKTIDIKQDEILAFVKSSLKENRQLHAQTQQVVLQESEKTRQEMRQGFADLIEKVSAIEKRERSAIAEYRRTQAAEKAATGIISELIERDPFFVDRKDEQASLLQRLEADEKMLVITATSGYGKTSLMTEVLHGIAPHGEIKSKIVQGILIFYCRERSLTLRDVCVQADWLTGKDKSRALTESYDLYRQDKLPRAEVVANLLLALREVGNVWLVFDNFETMLDGAQVADEELREFFVKALKTANRMRFLLTSQKVPQFEGVQTAGKLEMEALPPNFAKDFLRSKGAELKKERAIDCGLADADERTLDELLEKITSIPMALVSFVGYLAAACQTLGTVLADVLADESVFRAFREHDAKAGAMHLIEKQFLSHNDTERLILRALSIFPKPVPFPILSYTLPALDEKRILECLTSVSLVRRIGRNRYELLPQARQIISQQPERTDEPFSRSKLHTRAADFYASIRKPKTEWKTLEDLAPQFEEIYHCCQIGLFDRAASVLDKKAGDFLSRAGYSRRVVEVREELVGKPMSDDSTAYNLGWLVVAYSDLGENRKAIKYCEESLKLYRRLKDRTNEGVMLMNLGRAHFDLGENSKAIELYEQALVIHQEVGDRVSEGMTLMNLGNTHSNLSHNRKAIELYEQALAIHKEVGNRVWEGMTLMNLGPVHYDLGDNGKAIELYEQALVIHREVGNRVWEGMALMNLGAAYSGLGDHRKAIELYEQALPIHQEVGNKVNEGRTLGNLGVTKFNLGEKREGIRLVEQALEIARQVEDKMFEEVWLDRLKIMKD